MKSWLKLFPRLTPRARRRTLCHPFAFLGASSRCRDLPQRDERKLFTFLAGFARAVPADHEIFSARSPDKRLGGGDTRLLLFCRYFSLTASVGKAKGGESVRAAVGKPKGKEGEGGKESFSFPLFLPSRTLSQKGVEGARVLKPGWG